MTILGIWMGTRGWEGGKVGGWEGVRVWSDHGVNHRNNKLKVVASSGHVHEMIEMRQLPNRRNEKPFYPALISNFNAKQQMTMQ